MSWNGGLTWISREVNFYDAKDVETSFASPHTRPGYPGRVGQPGYPGRPPSTMQRMLKHPLCHSHPTRMSWKGGPTWISRKVTNDDGEDIDISLMSLIPDQDVLEGNVSG